MANTALSVSCQANVRLTSTERTFLCHRQVQSYKKHEKVEIPEEFTRANMSALCRSPWSFSVSLGPCLSVCLAFSDLVGFSYCVILTQEDQRQDGFGGSERLEEQSAFIYGQGTSVFIIKVSSLSFSKCFLSTPPSQKVSLCQFASL